MPLVTTRAVVLQTHRYSDTSKILRLMTREHGPRSTIAKGALRPKSRFGGVLEPFAEGAATFYVKENRDLHTLSAFELVRERQALGSDLERFAAASVLCELVLRLAPEHRDLRLYRSLVGGLDDLVAAPKDRVSATGLRQIWELVGVLGFAPDLTRCLECGRPIPGGQMARFDFPAGGLRCGRCPAAGRRLSSTDVATLRSLVGGREPDDPPAGQAALLVDFIRYHLAEGIRLRSLPFLGELGAMGGGAA